MRKIISLLTVSASALVMSTNIQAAESDNIWDALKNGTPELNLRYRIESVDQDGFDKDATSSTLQTMLGYRSGSVNGLSGYVQFRNVATLGGSKYNSTVNGKSMYPVIADPSSTEVDQAYLQYKTLGNTTIRAGRQKLIFGNKRFVSKLAWRQNQRSFDSVVITSAPAKNLSIAYGYAWNVNRAFTDRSPKGNLKGNFHLTNVGYNIEKFGKLTAYSYLIDVEHKYALGLSTKTMGLNFKGTQPIGEGMKLGYELEYANQKDYKDNPYADLDVNYFHANTSISAGKANFKVGHEILGGDGVKGFSTPLALLHAYNGWADKFLGTPANGLKDTYGSVSYKIAKGVKATAAYHHFKAEEGGLKYGTEWDAVVTFPVMGPVKGLVKAAFYNADNYATDTTKLWFMLMSKF